MKKLPPIEKIYEAYSAIVDKRVTMPVTDSGMSTAESSGKASIVSSDGTKTYTVTWQDDIYSSNDNATYWQGYAGYPIIAVLMLQNRLPFDLTTAQLFTGINWTETNRRRHGNYSAALEDVMAERNYDRKVIDTVVQGVYARLETLPIIIRRSPIRPPK